MKKKGHSFMWAVKRMRLEDICGTRADWDAGWRLHVDGDGFFNLQRPKFSDAFEFWHPRLADVIATDWELVE